MAAPGRFQQATLIAVDWGTSRVRARLVDARVNVLAEAESGEGIGQIDAGHEAVFERLVAGWPKVPAIMAGMVGSRQGWREIAYVPCPATPASVAAEVIRFETTAGRPVAIVPGLVLNAISRDGDVMRGEETQMIGLIDREPDFAGIAILPGTHSKWARIDKGAIIDFQTFITGELFDLLSRVSLLRHSVAEDGNDLTTSPDFALGVERTAKEDLPFLNALFSVRARQLLMDVNRESNLAYLSGIMIGGEIAAARTVAPLVTGAPVRVVGSKALARAYQKALEVLGGRSEMLDGDGLALGGLAHVARAIGLLPARAG